ncbi:probable BOI-related E3 ubiquitin-protein ligase 2 [Quercus suber]|uniref:Boi-related e3 ubiquitin-protein ligase 3 n=1 Tax=Quercus suber TaxID=58331 RepID=A0AAW0KCG3_QUESU|nr:probable BOI-related E3 ubiquitin-protein ligase 2 [Quercus suber]
MASFPQHQFQPHYQPQQQHQQQQQSKSFRNLYTIDGQISQPVSYYNPTTHLQDQSQHPPYIPSFHVVGLAPGPVAANDGSDGGAELQWNYGVEPRKKRLKEQDFLENNSQISSVDFFQPRSVSTGLGLSLDNNTRMASTGDSALLSLIGDDIDRELQRHDAEIDRFLKVQGDRLQQNILEKVQATQLQTLSLVEEKVLQKLREKEAEMESINRKNEELEERMEQLTVEAGAWQQRARYNENMISALKVNLQQVYAQSRDSKEGCGDSEVDDTASCCNGRSIDFHLLCKENNDMKEIMTCKACRVNEVCMLLLPCKHLCLCKECESKLSFCPLCQSSKFIGMEVYM